jgi:hypothetical protein
MLKIKVIKQRALSENIKELPRLDKIKGSNTNVSAAKVKIKFSRRLPPNFFSFANIDSSKFQMDMRP